MHRLILIVGRFIGVLSVGTLCMKTVQPQTANNGLHTNSLRAKDKKNSFLGRCYYGT